MYGELVLTPAVGYPPGTVLDLLWRSYVSLGSIDVRRTLDEFEREIQQNPDTVGACTYVSCLGGQPVGMVSWDPRQAPKAVLGHNCILPEFQGRGLGRRQIQEALRLLRESGMKTVEVRTGADAFFEPARRMYEACGFRRKRREGDWVIYERDL